MADAGRISQGSAELIALGRSLGGQVCAIVIGDAESARAAIAAGADRVLLAEETPEVSAGERDARLQCHEQACREYPQDLVLVGETDDGAEVGPRLAARLDAACAQGCTSVEVGPGGEISATRPVYGGNALARLSFPPDRMAIIVGRAGMSDPLPQDPERTGEVVRLSPVIDPGRVRVRSTRTVRQDPAGVGLEEARVVVGGGRGLGGPDPFGQLGDLAVALGGAVGASRAACDAGWIDHSRQIGLTGKRITPDLYITFGISGASQHMAGCGEAKAIVAVNSDGSAPIFRQAQFGVVGDWKAVLTGFMAAVMELRGD